MKNKESKQEDTLTVSLYVNGIKTDKNRAQFMAALSHYCNYYQIVNVSEYKKSGRFYGYDCMLKKKRLFTVEELNALFYVMLDSQTYATTMLCASFIMRCGGKEGTLQELLNNLRYYYL